MDGICIATNFSINEVSNRSVAKVMVNVKVQDLNEHLTCPLCNGYLIDATTITSCLHSFCRSCIHSHLSQKPVCPSCEKSHPNFQPKSSPKLKYDRILQALVYKIVPGLYQRELAERFKFVERNPGRDNRILRWSDEYLEDKKAFVSPAFSKDETFSICLKRQISYPIKNVDASTGIQSYLLCPGRMKIALLKKFILMKLGLLDNWQVIFFNASESFSDRCTLVDVAYIKGWNKILPLVIDYYLINPHLEGIQLCCSTMKRPKLNNRKKRSQTLSISKPETLNNSVKITESSPTSGIKIRIRLSDSMKQGARTSSVGGNFEPGGHTDFSNPPTSTPLPEIKKEVVSPNCSLIPSQLRKDGESSRENGATSRFDDDDFEPASKRVKHDGNNQDNINKHNYISNNVPSNSGKDRSSNQNDTTTCSSVVMKKRGRPKKIPSTYGKLSILSLLKRRWPQDAQTKMEPITSPYKNESLNMKQNINNSPASTDGNYLQQDPSVSIKLSNSFYENNKDDSELTTGCAGNGNELDNENDGNTSIVTFREDDMHSPFRSPVNEQGTTPQPPVQEQQLPIIDDNAIMFANKNCVGNLPGNLLKNIRDAEQQKKCNIGESNNTCIPQMKLPMNPDISLFSQPPDFQKLLLLAQQQHFLIQNQELFAAYNQRFLEMANFQNPCLQKIPEVALPLQHHIQIGNNSIENGTSLNNHELFSVNKPLQAPDYLNSALLNQQVSSVFLTYPQFPFQPLVLPSGLPCNLMQNLLNPNQKTSLEVASLIPEHLSSLTVPVPYSLVYPPAQLVPDYGSYMDVMPQQMTPKPNQLYQDLSHSYEEVKESYVLLKNYNARNKSFLTDEGIGSIDSVTERLSNVEQITNQIEANGGYLPVERPLFSPVSVDEDDKRNGYGLIPESALDPSKEICVEKYESSLNSSRTSDMSV